MNLDEFEPGNVKNEVFFDIKKIFTQLSALK